MARAEGAEARWELGLREAGVYNVSAWWAGDPDAPGNWTEHATYTVVGPDGKTALASATLNQTRGGDTWNLIAANLALAPGSSVVLKCQDARLCVADALLVESAARYNDGTPVGAEGVWLEPMDGIVLRRA